MSENTLPPLRLKRGEDRRLRAGHLWVFSNEVDTGATPLQGFQPGDPVEIQAAGGRPLGNGYVNPHSLICARLVTRRRDLYLDRSLIVHRLNIALSLRRRVYERPCYRLVYGESDGLPGLIVDRFDGIVVVQITTAGMERQREAVISALQKVLDPSAILLRNDSAMRSLEGLPEYVEPVVGEVPTETLVEEDGVRFAVSLHGGQKTGWYYDQHRNRVRLKRYARDARVLDLYSYVGGFALAAAAGGAREVVAVETSESAAGFLARNVSDNGFDGRVEVAHADVHDVLAGLRAERERFDVVVLDPPAFIKRKKDLRRGVEGYRRINQLAMQVLAHDGVLVTSSCSYHLASADLKQLLQRTARHLDREVQLVEQGHQAPDHPVHPAIGETEYLKTFFARVLLP